MKAKNLLRGCGGTPEREEGRGTKLQRAQRPAHRRYSASSHWKRALCYVHGGGRWQTLLSASAHARFFFRLDIFRIAPNAKVLLQHVTNCKPKP